ncbi:MAG: 4Fe-4S binding protein [Clostridia bacterium]|nr:4Fe-4S binding protein [Clostridia bacterium]
MKISQKLKRKAIQIAAFGLNNCHVGNFFQKGGAKLYTGPWKQFCAPGLNCYSCPAASVSCPIGALQAVSGSMKLDFSFYVVGFLLAVGVLLGRFVCGFLCPFGLIQELLAKIPLPKKKLRLPRFAKYIKYVVLVVFVILMPVAVTNVVGMGDPAFCQYICPSGTLLGGVPLLSTHPELQQTIGWLFGWKMFLLIAILTGSVLVFRFFCKTLCPLGAIYGLLNKVSFYRLTVDGDKCIHCGKCAQVCGMDVDPTKHPQSMECIRCGECAQACPTGAIRLGFGVFRRKEEGADGNMQAAACTPENGISSSAGEGASPVDAKPAAACTGHCASCTLCGSKKE